MDQASISPANSGVRELPKWADVYKAELHLLTPLTAFVVACYWTVRLDDAYIYYTYAKNIALGNGYAFSPPEHWNGTTSPLYTLVLSSVYFPLRWINGLSLPLIGHVLGGVFLWFALYFGIECFRRSGLHIVATAFPVLLIANPYIKNGIGMETFLTLMVIMGGTYFYQRGRIRVAAVFSALAVLSRPDSLLWVAALLGHYLVTRRHIPCRGAIAAFIVIVGTWCLFSKIYFGGFIPSTVGVKITQSRSNLFGSGPIFVKGLIWKSPANPIITRAISLMTIVCFGFAVTRWRQWRDRDAIVVLLVWNLAYLAAFVVMNPPPYPWYYTPLSIGISLVIALSLELAIGRYKTNFITPVAPKTQYLWSLGVVACCALILPIQSAREGLPPQLLAYSSASAWLNNHAPLGSSVACYEVGELGYHYRNGKVVDALGLVTPGVAKHLIEGDSVWYINHYQPNYVLFHLPLWHPFEDCVTEPWFSRLYASRTTIRQKGFDLILFQRTPDSRSRL